MNKVDDTLVERGNRYGVFSEQAKIANSIRSAMNAGNWDSLSPSMKESLHLIANKIGRILNGDPNYADNWHDIAGYATLIDKEFNGEKL